MNMVERPACNQDSAISYGLLRAIIGILGITLPFVLGLGAWLFFSQGIQSTLSYYYYTHMGNVFVGTLCAIGVFLFSYRGFKVIDDVSGTISGVCAVGMALFPTRPIPPPGSTPGVSPTANEIVIGYIHVVFAAVFFLTLIYMAMWLFTKTNTKTDPDANPEEKLSENKKKRNRIYKACGIIMIICLILIVVYWWFKGGALSSWTQYHPIFWLESIAVIAFGTSWLIKAEVIVLKG